MPFIQRPEGFSSETLAMLDMAMSELWLEQAAMFLPSAALSAGNPPQQSAEATNLPDTTKSASGNQA